MVRNIIIFVFTSSIQRGDNIMLQIASIIIILLRDSKKLIYIYMEFF